MHVNYVVMKKKIFKHVKVAEAEISAGFEPFTIRKGSLKDLYRLFDLYHCDMLKGPEVFSESVEKRVYFDHLLDNEYDEMSLWVAETQSGEILGWQSLVPCESDEELKLNFGECITFVFDDSLIPIVGAGLLASAVGEGKKANLLYLTSYIISSNKALQLVAKEAGFKQVTDFKVRNSKPIVLKFFLYTHMLFT
jgi:L-amino acid N-acyltransferase YncA